MGRKMQTYEPLTPEQVARAMLFRNRKMRGGGIMSWDQVARHMRMGAHRLMSHLDPTQLAKYRAKKRDSSAYFKGRRIRATRGPAAFSVPEYVLDARDHRATLMARCTDPNITMLGDRPPWHPQA